jgi:hypothetical protein
MHPYLFYLSTMVIKTFPKRKNSENTVSKNVAYLIPIEKISDHFIVETDGH